MRVLTLDAAGDSCSAGLVVDGLVVMERSGEGGRGQGAVLPRLVQDVLGADARLDQVAVTVGPGSFTGIRAALALAQGIGLAAGAPVVGVTLGAVLAEDEAITDGITFWTAMRARAGHVFLQRGEAVHMHPLDALPDPGGPVVLGGNAAAAVAERWAAHPVRVSDASPRPSTIARAAARHGRPPDPLYVEPPRTSAPKLS